MIGKIEIKDSNTVENDHQIAKKMVNFYKLYSKVDEQINQI